MLLKTSKFTISTYYKCSFVWFGIVKKFDLKGHLTVLQ